MNAYRRYVKLLRPYARYYAAGLFLLILSTVFSLSVPWLVKHAVDTLAILLQPAEGRPPLPSHLGGLLQSPISYAIALAIAGLVNAAVRTGSRVLFLGTGRRVSRDLKKRLFERLDRAAPSFYSKFPTGEIMSRGTYDIMILQAVAAPGALHTFNAIFMFGVAIPYLASIDGQLTLALLAPYPFLAIFTMLLVTRVKRYAKQAQAAMADVTTRVQEALAGMDVVRAFTLEKREAARFAASNDDYLEKSMKEAVTRGGIGIVAALTGGVGAAAILWFGGGQVATGELTYGDLALFLSVMAM
ncbi:ABC transporter transmembrane domain-containing protein, partial [Planctomycetota bacterium]|nr:ABC transporter transmembrane domain-containing protein [Planctomycetota bacterium]